MGGAIIYLVIVVVWAVVLVPRWLRAHDNATAAESSPDSDEAPHGRVLTQRSAHPAAEVEPEPTAEATEPEPAAEATEPTAAEAGRGGRNRRYDPRSRAHRAAVRRRIVFAALLAAAAGCSVAAGYGYLPWWSLAAPTAGLGVYLVHVRRLIVAEHTRQRRVARARRPGESAPATADAGAEVPLPTSMGAYRARRAGARMVDPDVVFDQHAAQRWQPQPVPLPTYLTAPAATRTHRATVSVDQYDEESSPAEEAEVHDIRRAVGG